MIVIGSEDEHAGEAARQAWVDASQGQDEVFRALDEHLERRRFHAAEQLCAQLDQHARQSGSPADEARALLAHGQLALAQHHDEVAELALDEACMIWRHTPSPHDEARGWALRATLLQRQQRPDEALRARVMARQCHERTGESARARQMSWRTMRLALDARDHDCLEAEAAWWATQHAPAPAVASVWRGASALDRGEVEHATRLFSGALLWGRRHRTQTDVVAWAQIGLVLVALARQDTARALELLSQARAWSARPMMVAQALRVVVQPRDRGVWARARASAHQQHERALTALLDAWGCAQHPRAGARAALLMTRWHDAFDANAAMILARYESRMLWGLLATLLPAAARRRQALSEEHPREALLVDRAELAVRPPHTPRWHPLREDTNLGKLLLCLLDAHTRAPGQVLSTATLRDHLWPQEQLIYEAAINRLHVTLNQGRRMGLQEVIVRRHEGYMLSPSCLIISACSEQGSSPQP